MKRFLIIIFLLFPITVFGNNFWQQNNISKPKHYIFGYGSLVNSESRAASLKCQKSVVAARISPEFGYKRVWNYRGPGFTALGLVKTENATSINGIIYGVDESNMDILDEREKDYIRVEVPWELVESVDWMHLPKDGHLWIYVPINCYPPSPNYPLLQSYIDTCVTGFLEYSEEFAIEFLETTEGWSPYWLNDRILARRPWVHFSQYKTVDKILVKYPQKNNTFCRRMYVSEWGVVE